MINIQRSSLRLFLVMTMTLIALAACVPPAAPTSNDGAGDPGAGAPAEQPGDSNPLQTLPPPELCNPDAPELAPPQQASDIRTPEDEQGRPFFQIDLAYTNSADEQFLLTVSSPSQEALEEFIQSTQACFESVVFTGEVGYPIEIDESGSDSDETPLVAFLQHDLYLTAALFELSDNESNIAVEVEIIHLKDESYEQDAVIYFVVDPFINQGAWHSYRSKCSTSGYASITALQGGARVHVWGGNPWFWNSASAQVGGVNPSGWIGQSVYPNWATYDAGVDGLANGSQYTIAGGWIIGWGGERCN